MYYGSGTADRIASREPADAAAYATAVTGRMLRVRSPDGSTFLHEMTSWPPS